MPESANDAPNRLAATFFDWLLGGSEGRRFALTFVALAGALLSVYYFPYPPDSWMQPYLERYLRGYASIAGGVLRWFEPTLQVDGRQIVGRFSLNIVKTCDAMDVQILLLSAVIAWPTTWQRRAVAALVGTGAIFVLNVTRICSLYYVGILRPSSFDLMHLEVWPAILLIVVCAGFLVWARSEDPRLSKAA